MVNVAKAQATADGFDLDHRIQAVKFRVEPSVMFAAGKPFDPGRILGDEQIIDQPIEKLIMEKRVNAVIIMFPLQPGAVRSMLSKNHRARRAGASGGCLAQSLRRLKILVLPNFDWKIVRFHPAGPPP